MLDALSLVFDLTLSRLDSGIFTGTRWEGDLTELELQWGRTIGQLGTGDCFGEASYVPGARRSASVRTGGNVTLLKVGATLLEQASAACQLRFNRMFLRSLIERLQKNEVATGA